VRRRMNPRAVAHLTSLVRVPKRTPFPGHGAPDCW
jgi:hypothetical protein